MLPLIWLALDAGEQDYILELYRTYKDGMWRYACSIAHDPDAADDIVHGVFEALIGKIGLLQTLDDYKLRAYIAVSVKHRALQHNTARGKLASIEPDDLASPDAPPFEWMLSMEMIVALHRAVDRLPDREKQVIALRYATDKRYRQVGEALGITEVHARKIAERARRRLRGMLAEEGVESVDR